jgi:heme-degrading monooxygenase HmoA
MERKRRAHHARKGKLKFMHIIIWEFTVREERIQEFISAYKADGDWGTLFRRAEGYLGTQLLRSSEAPNTFLTIDRWESSNSFEVFRKRFGTEYEELDAQCESYTLSERNVGVFSQL